MWPCTLASVQTSITGTVVKVLEIYSVKYHKLYLADFLVFPLVLNGHDFDEIFTYGPTGK